MNLSVLIDDPGYRPDHAEFVVLYNGEPQSLEQSGRSIVTADEGERRIWFREMADDGGLVAFACGLEFDVQELEGAVSIYRISSDYLPRRG